MITRPRTATPEIAPFAVPLSFHDAVYSRLPASLVTMLVNHFILPINFSLSRLIKYVYADLPRVAT